MSAIIGRQNELKILEEISEKDRSSFLAVYGRRRVGKTFLINSYFQGGFDFYLTGLLNGTFSQQLMNFHLALLKYAPKAEIDPAKDWFTAFRQLENLIRASQQKKKVIFLDELPWMDTPRSRFESALGYFWNNFASARDDIIFIVCGSDVSWMKRKLINNIGGLYNRVTDRIIVYPFTLKETAAYFAAKQAHFDHYQLLQLYMVMGGIPAYLDQVDPKESATENINRIFLGPDSRFRREYSHLYNSTFKNPHTHVAITEALAKQGRGMTHQEMASALKISSGGSLVRALKELEQNGLICKYPAFGKRQRGALYQLVDLYSLFYHTFLKNDQTGKAAKSWMDMKNPKYTSWRHYSFELIAVTHIQAIKKAIGISGVATYSSSWADENTNSGAQFALVIERGDRIINLCEFEFSLEPFEMTQAYDNNLRSKKWAFSASSKTKRLLLITFITPYGLLPNMYSISNVHDNLKMDIFFE